MCLNISGSSDDPQTDPVSVTILVSSDSLSHYQDLEIFHIYRIFLKLFIYYWVEETVSNCNAAIGDLEPADTEMQKACYTTAAERGMGVFFLHSRRKRGCFFNNM